MPGARIFGALVWVPYLGTLLGYRIDGFILEVPAAVQGISFWRGRAVPESGNLRGNQ
jgi:hypothetical protein